MAIEDWSEEDAARILDQVRDRLPARNYYLGLALADVLELRLPDDVDPIELEYKVWMTGFSLIIESSDGESEK